MNVKKVIPCGFCKGVINAITIAKQTKQNYNSKKIYILGMIVHNSHVVKELEDLGIITLDTTSKTKEQWIDEINDGVIILTAHGTPNSIKQKIINKGLILVDATCNDVLKTEESIKKYINLGYQVLYYGKKDHPEAISALSISNNINLITEKKDIDEIIINNNSILISQTTMSQEETIDIYNYAKIKNNNIKYIQGICNATDQRQHAIKNLKDCDILYIIGDKISNNTLKLKEVAQSTNIKKVFLIDNKNEINIKDINEKDNIYITAGASTPTYLIDETIEYIKSKI